MAKIKLADYLKMNGSTIETLHALARYRKAFDRDYGEGNDPEEYRHRVRKPPVMYTGNILGVALAALLAGKHLILAGPKATGKNTLAETLSFVLNRPLWELSGHVHADYAQVVGEKTLDERNRVVFEEGPLLAAMQTGGILVLDEGNMLRPEVLAVIHAATDHRRRIEVKEVGVIEAHPAFRVILTMNLGYAGTQPLNEATKSRFVVLHMPMLSEDNLKNHLVRRHGVSEYVAGHLTRLFLDLNGQAQRGELYPDAVNFRGIEDALDMTKLGVPLQVALIHTLAGQAFYEDDRNKVYDLIVTTTGEDWGPDFVFGSEDDEEEDEDETRETNDGAGEDYE